MFIGHIMTLFFNLETLEAQCKGDYGKFITYLHLHLQRRLFKPFNLHGLSFLLNPEPLFRKDNKVDILYKIQYIKLAARRDYGLYKLYGQKTLDLSYFPDINISAIRTNPLISIKNNQIFFLYEEASTKKGN